MVAAGGGIDPNWVIAGLSAIGAFVGAWRLATHFFADRRERQDDYQRLYRDFYGWPAETDDYGNIIAPARRGIAARVSALEKTEAARHG